MLPFTIRINIVALLIVFVICNADGLDRKIISVLNPDCQNDTKEQTLIYTKAVGSEDTIHQLWDFTGGIPTIIFAIGSVNSSLKVYWKDAKPMSFVMSPTPRYSFAASIDTLYEYNDLKDNGYIEPSYPQRLFSLQKMIWRRNETILTENEAMVTIRGHFPERRGHIDMKLDLLPFKDYALELPHLIHTANSTLVDISLVNLTTTRHYNESRYALRFVLVSTDESSDTMHYAMRKSLDDEHTPGIFEIVEIKTPESYQKGDGGFIQFRPVGYVQRDRGVTTSTLAHVSSFNRTEIRERSTIGKFYKNYNRNYLLVQDMLISFGETGDGYYSQHNYTAWSFTTGYGTPPIENFSLFVVLIISIGLGVPVVLALSGVVYVVLRKYRARNVPARFTDDE